MTVQIPDTLWIAGRKRPLFRHLPLNAAHPRIVARQPDEPWSFTTACWRGSVGHWAVFGDQLWLVGIEGALALESADPILASWVTTVLEVTDGAMAGRGRRHIIELDLEAGRVVRERVRVAAMDSEPGVGFLLSCPTRDDPRVGRPSLASFLNAGLQGLVGERRRALGLRFGQVAVRMGRRPQKGSRVAEWERGQRDPSGADWERLRVALDISQADWDARRREGQEAFEAAMSAWRAQRCEPVLLLEGELYTMPPALRREGLGLRKWAERCVHLTWMDGVLVARDQDDVSIPALGERQARPWPPAPEAILAAHSSAPEQPPFSSVGRWWLSAMALARADGPSAMARLADLERRRMRPFQSRFGQARRRVGAAILEDLDPQALREDRDWRRGTRWHPLLGRRHRWRLCGG